MKRTVSVTVALVLVYLAGCGADPHEASRKAALKSAGAWLGLVDSGSYAESWDTAATQFKAVVKKGDWEQMVGAVRQPFGKVLTREVKSQQYTTALPGAPDGEYVVIQFETSFENKKSAVETITPSREEDGTWRVSGYYIK